MTECMICGELIKIEYYEPEVESLVGYRIVCGDCSEEGDLED